MLNAYAKRVFRTRFAKHVFLIAWWNIGFMCCISLFLARMALHSYASVRMRTAAYRSLFVCVCVCVSVCLCITAITAQRLKCKCK